MQAIKDYENNKWKVIGQKVGKPAKVRSMFSSHSFPCYLAFTLVTIASPRIASRSRSCFRFAIYFDLSLPSNPRLVMGRSLDQGPGRSGVSPREARQQPSCHVGRPTSTKPVCLHGRATQARAFSYTPTRLPNYRIPGHTLPASLHSYSHRTRFRFPIACLLHTCSG